MNFDLYSAAVGGVALWLLGWIGKHLLDRLLLPRFFDWWARRNKGRALRRAEKLRRYYRIDMLILSDIRHLVILAMFVISASISFVGIVLAILSLEGFRLLTTPDPPSASQASFYYYYYSVVAPLFIIAIPIVILLINRRYNSWIINPAGRRAEIIGRIRRLLTAAGLENDAIVAWLETISPAPPIGFLATSNDASISEMPLHENPDKVKPRFILEWLFASNVPPDQTARK